jgi:hypothetical protein
MKGSSFEPRNEDIPNHSVPENLIIAIPCQMPHPRHFQPRPDGAVENLDSFVQFP